MVLTRNLHTTKMQTTSMSEVCLLICLERGLCFFVCRWEVYPSLRENKPPPLYGTFLFCHNIQIFSTQVCGKQIFTAYIYISSFRYSIEWSFSHPEDEQADTPGVAAVQA